MPATGNSELRRVMRERDELQTLLDKFERHMAEVCSLFTTITCQTTQISSCLGIPTTIFRFFANPITPWLFKAVPQYFPYEQTLQLRYEKSKFHES